MASNFLVTSWSTPDPSLLSCGFQAQSIKEHLAKFGDKLPKQLAKELGALEQRLG